ncbi:MAG: ornithine cyclodeaminase family protein [Acidimicrobiales bacterium]
MGSIAVIGAGEVRALLDLEDLRRALTDALIAIASGSVSAPPRIAALGGDGLLGAMPACAPGLGLAAKLVTVFPGNGQRGLPSHQAVIVAFDEATGAPLALLDGTYITAIRTGMTAAIAARALGDGGGSPIAIIGAGVQGAAHLVALRQLFPASELRIASRDPERAARLAGQDPSAAAIATLEEAVRGASIVCCCTDARGPVIDDEWIEAGVHVSSVGSGRELPPATIGRAEVFVESTVALQAPPAGAVELHGRDPSSVTLLGDVLAGRTSGRSGPSAVTVYKSTGHAAEDLAAVAVVLRARGARDNGATVNLT